MINSILPSDFEPTRRISIVVPVYNEEDNLRELLERLLDTCARIDCDKSFEIILVDDGSRDASARLISQATEEHAGLVVGVLLNRNYGQHAAVMAGFSQATGDAVITLDADLQNPPEEIPKLVAKLDEGYDVVGSIRLMRRDSVFRRYASQAINWLVRKATGVYMSDYGCMLRAYRRHVVEAMLACHERSTFIPILANSFARRSTEVYVHHAERVHGESKYSLMALVNLQFDLLTSMTTAPLRLLSMVGGVIALLGFLFGLALLVLRLLYGAEWGVNGVFPLFAVLFIFIGAQFVGLGLLGEYLGRIYYDVRARPRYFIQAIIGREGVTLQTATKTDDNRKNGDGAECLSDHRTR